MTGKQTQADNRPLVVIIAGLSGSGRSSAVHALEDLSFYCIDNIPVDLVEPSVDFFLKQTHSFHRFGIGVDLRAPQSIEKLTKLKKSLDAKVRLDFIFLTADEDVLIRRYSTTRRKHPLIDEGGHLLAAIRREAHLLSSLQDIADVVYDTSAWSPHYLTRNLESRYAAVVKGRNLHVTLISFGFKYGILRSADSIYDIRFLRNPYFDPRLKDKTGLEPDIEKFIFEDPNTQTFLDKMIDLHRFLLPNYYREGKHYFRIGIGCTGGMHRSVLMSEHLARKISELELPNIVVSVSHRDLNQT